MKGSSITKTFTEDKFAPAGQDLFSHPYSYEWPAGGDSFDGRDVARDNLFSEQADAGIPSPRGEAERPPRNPFDAKAVSVSGR